MKKYIMFVVSMMTAAILMLWLGLRFPTMVSLIVLVSGVGADFLTTYLCLKENRKEGNPIIALLFKKLTVGGTFALLGCMWVAFIWLRWLPSTLGIQTAVACVYWAVPVNNLIVLKKARAAGRS